METETIQNKTKSIAITAGFHILMLAICYFGYISTPFGSGSIEGNGLVMNFGTVDLAAGDDLYSLLEPNADPNADGRFSKQFQGSERTDPDFEGEKRNILTQDSEDAPGVIQSDLPGTRKKDDTNPKDENQPPLPNPSALYKGPAKKSEGSGDGTGTQPGNQGSRTGDPNSPNYVGGEGNGGGIALNLSGRRFVSPPVISDDGQTTGRVAVDITVDRNGVIVNAKGGARGTTIQNAELWRKCELAVLGARLNTISSGPDIQIGTVIFTFILE